LLGAAALCDGSKLDVRASKVVDNVSHVLLSLLYYPSIIPDQRQIYWFNATLV
jgi:hypothetical protein